jgi:hypothetical protein
MEIVKHEEQGGLVSIARALVPGGMKEAVDFATAAAKSGLYQVRSPEAALMIIATGMELGLAPSQALRGIDIIEGKTRLSADLMVAVVRGRKSVCKYFRLVESTDERATWETHRVGEAAPVRMTFTKADAERAGLWGKRTWATHPRVMLRHRAASQLARAVYQDVLFGTYTPDEIEEIPAVRVEVTRVDEPAPTEPNPWAARIPSARGKELLEYGPQIAALKNGLRDEAHAAYAARWVELLRGYDLPTLEAVAAKLATEVPEALRAHPGWQAVEEVLRERIPAAEVPAGEPA